MTAKTAKKKSMSTSKKTDLRVVNSPTRTEAVKIPWGKIALTSAFSAAVVYGTVEGIKYLRRRASNPAQSEEKTKQQALLAQLSASNPSLFQSPLMQQIAAMNGMAPQNPMLSPPVPEGMPQQEEAPVSEVPPWFKDFSTRLQALEKKPKAKRTRRPKPRIVEEDEYEEDEYEDAS